MKKHTKKLICGVAILLIGLFLWNDSLYDKRPELPFTSEQVKLVFLLPEKSNSETAPHIESVSDANKAIVLKALQDMDLIADTALQEQVAEEQKPWWGEELCRVELLLNTDFWNRTPSGTLSLFADGHVMIQYSSPSKPYPHIVDFGHEYSYMRYYKAQSEDYDALVETICSVRDIYCKTYETMYYKAANAQWECNITIKDDTEEEQFDTYFQINYLGNDAKIGEELYFMFCFADKKSASLSFSGIWEEGKTSWKYHLGRTKMPIDHFIPATFIVEIGDDDENRVEMEFVEVVAENQ